MTTAPHWIALVAPAMNERRTPLPHNVGNHRNTIRPAPVPGQLHILLGSVGSINWAATGWLELDADSYHGSDDCIMRTSLGPKRAALRELAA